jgi:hypothetical protein
MKFFVCSFLCFLVLISCQKNLPPPVELDRLIEDLERSPIVEESAHEATAWRSLGVSRIRTVPSHEAIDLRATLLNAKGLEVGSIEISWSEGSQTVVVITRVAGHQAKIELGPEGALQLTDLATGRSGRSSFDPETKTFGSDPMLDLLQAEFSAIIPIAMGTLNAVEMQRRHNATAGEAVGEAPFDIVDPATDPLWQCSGSWYRGGAYWGTRSGCCVIAREAAADQCSNWSCYGCCVYRSCDSWCSRGDYFCVCGISGRSCG